MKPLCFSFLLLILVLTVQASAKWRIIEDPQILSSTFLEPRFDHLHLGIDLKTPSGVNTPIYAPDDGYVVRVKTSYYGYGKSMHFKCYSGKTIFLAHLSRFASPIEEAILKVQHQRRRYAVELWARKDEFSFKKGEIIAYSGETGVGGPHIHLEIRDPKGNFVNPAGFIETNDFAQPVINRLLVIPIDDSTIKGFRYPQAISPLRVAKNHYVIQHPIGFSGKILLAIECTDYADLFSKNRLGIYKASLFVEDSLVYSFSFDDFPDTLFYAVNSFFSLWEGNTYYNLFDPELKKGVILTNKSAQKARIVVEDFFANKATLDFELIQYDNLSEKVSKGEFENCISGSSDSLYNISSSIVVLCKRYFLALDFESELSQAPLVVISFFDGKNKELGTISAIAEHSTKRRYYLPFQPPRGAGKMRVQVIVNHKKYEVEYETMYVEKGKVRTYSLLEERLLTRFSEAVVLESFWLFGRTNKENTIEIYPVRPPLKGKFELAIKLGPDSSKRGFIALSMNGNNYRFTGAKVKDGYIWGTSLFGGCFSYKVDTEPPEIIFPFKDAVRLRQFRRVLAKVVDKGSGLGSGASLNLFIDNKWVPAEFDFEKGILKYELKDPLGNGEHEIRIEAIDRVGNKNVETRKVVIIGEK